MKDEGFTVSVVEDEAVLRQEMAFQLRHNGFAVETFESAAAFYRYLATHPRTIAVLDIGLSGEDGLSVCRYLRQHDERMGIVFVTARSLREDRLEGLARGADAYLVKPVDMDELMLILKRLAARFAQDDSAAAPARGGGGGWQLDPFSGFLLAPNQARLRLSMNEQQVFKALLARSGEVCRTGELALAIGFNPDEVDKHRIEVIVSRLRSKVERECGLVLPVRSVRGQGYVLELVA
ncbi:MAG: hypothetical protein A2Z93_08415 [Curvibacter sp. GWA2_64_110]|nr:MAG: hypothetical protein A2Z93_08415 [Curvibacter sp. GWA2_64_110]